MENNSAREFDLAINANLKSQYEALAQQVSEKGIDINELCQPSKGGPLDNKQRLLYERLKK